MLKSIRSLYHSPDPREIMPHVSQEEIASYLRDLAGEYPRIIRVEEAGRSVEGRPLWLVTITDSGVADEEKEIVFCVAQEHGDERSAALALLEMIEWLTTDEAAEARRRLIVAVIPCVNPDGWDPVCFANKKGANLFADYSLQGPCSQPESEAVRQALIRLRPEVLANLHGTWRGSRYRAVDGSGLAYATSQFERSHARLFVEEMARAAEAAGYPQDRGEEDAERIVSWIPGGEYHCFGSMFGITPGVYAYHHFHTLSVCMEVVEPQSGVARMKRLLQMGYERWRTETVPGYPTRVAANVAHAYLCASGRTAAERRASRVELWRRQGESLLAYGVSARIGFDVAAYSPSFADKRAWVHRKLGDVLKQLGGAPGMDVAAMARIAAGQEDLTLLPTEERSKPPVTPATPEEALTCPIGLRLRLPTRAQVREVQVNGHPLSPGGMGGYSMWDTPNGWRMLQADLPNDLKSGGRCILMVRYE